MYSRLLNWILRVTRRSVCIDFHALCGPMGRMRCVIVAFVSSLIFCPCLVFVFCFVYLNFPIFLPLCQARFPWLCGCVPVNLSRLISVIFCQIDLHLL